MSILLFFIIFGVVVIAHELGHMMIAKLNGIKVNEFSIGMGPVLLKTQRGETVYSIRLLPIGGACIFEGEDGKFTDEEDDEKGNKAEQITASKEEFANNMELDKTSGAFQEAPVFARIASVVAGPIFNFVLAFLFSLIIVGSYGIDLPIVQQMMEDGAAKQAGMEDGDRIVSIDGKKVHIYREISLISMLNKGETLDIVYERNGEQFATSITPVYNQEADRYYIGFMGSGQYEKMGIGGTLMYSAYEVKYWISYTVKTLQMLITGQVSKNDIAGPVGMAQAVDQIYTESKTSGVYYIMLNMLNFAIILSANLGVLNLLPLPALDGGRLIFLIIEAVRRKPVPPEKEGMVHFAGFVMLMILMVFVLYNDIVRLFS